MCKIEQEKACKCNGQCNADKATLEDRVKELERKLAFVMAYTGADNIPEINQLVIMGLD